MKKIMSFVLNGESVQAEIEPHLTLLQLLREEFGLTGTKEGVAWVSAGLVRSWSMGRASIPAFFLPWRQKARASRPLRA